MAEEGSKAGGSQRDGSAEPAVPSTGADRPSARRDPGAQAHSASLGSGATGPTIADPHPPGALTAIPFEVDAELEPRLRRAVLAHRLGASGGGLGSTTPGDVAVVARVRSLDAWKNIPDVSVGATIGATPDGACIVTGRIRYESLDAVQAHGDVLSIESARPVRHELAATVGSLAAAPADLPKGTACNGGAGIVIGIVDVGCDFAHPNFLTKAGDTRLLAFWDQTAIPRLTSPYGYGRRFTPAEINSALADKRDPYATLGYDVGPDPAHGTHVMDIAAGNGDGTGQPGIAPEADLVFVEVSISDVPTGDSGVVGSALGDSVRLLDAVRYVFDVAGRKPCVCNVSLGMNGGPHDGTSLVEQGLDAIVAEAPNRAIVIAAGNSENRGCHAEGRVPTTGHHDLQWRHLVAKGGELEIWYDGALRLRATIIAPDGTVLGPVPAGGILQLGANGAVNIFAGGRLDDPNNHDNVLGIWISAGVQAGDWTVRLESEDGRAVDYHAWIERADSAQTSFVSPTGSHNLNSIATGRDSIVVGCFDAHKAGDPTSSFSSSGPTRDGRKKPEVSAPGQDVFAAYSRSANGVARMSGTSMAAPAVSGLVALIFAECSRKGAALDVDDLRSKLMTGLNGGNAGAWDAQRGHGRVHSSSIT